MMRIQSVVFVVAAVVGWLSPQAGAQTPLGSDFTYQGSLKQAGVLFDGTADFDFTLWDADVDGTQIESTVSLLGVMVTEGLFTVGLDFGAGALNGDERWLEITVDGNLLSPRQKVTGAPYSIQTRGLFVDDAGHVGIGTTTPGGWLQVGDNSNCCFDQGGGVGCDDSVCEAIVCKEDPFCCDTAWDGLCGNIAKGLCGDLCEQLIFLITSSGYVGIGTTDPSTAFDVDGVVMATEMNLIDVFPTMRFSASGTPRTSNLAASFSPIDVASQIMVFNVSDNTPEGTTEVMRLRGDGRVGIGTTNPSATLDVVGTTELNGDVSIDGTATATSFVGDGSGLTNLPAMEGVWSENGADIYYDTGNVGIGTTTPGGPLQVGDGVVVNSNCCFDQGGGVGCDDSECEAIVCKEDPFCCDTLWDEICGDIAKGLCGDLCEQLIFLITSRGYVGIGTTTPSTPLAIMGNGGINPVGITQNVLGGTSTMELTTTDPAGNQTTRILLRGGSNGDVADIEFYSGASGSEVQTMHIEGTNGRVGIGTDSPAEALHVCGNIRAEGDITASGSVTASIPGACPDYVFESDYELMPLDELSEYIKRNKHLPNVPSAEVVERDGIDLGGFSMRLLEKTEELTLYLLDQDKRLKEKDSEIQALADRLANLERLIEGAVAGKGELR